MHAKEKKYVELSIEKRREKILRSTKSKRIAMAKIDFQNIDFGIQSTPKSSQRHNSNRC